MQWLVYALAAAVLFGAWAFFGKLSLHSASWAQVALTYGIATVILFAPFVVVGARKGFSGVNGWWLAASAISGAVGLLLFYLALDRGNVSITVPLVGAYPLVAALLAILFLGESLTTAQAVGIALVVGGVTLIGIAS